MAVNSIRSGVYGYSGGSIASIRKQAEAIKERVGAETKARIAQQEETGLIKNPDTGEMVELSSISEETRESWNNREELSSISMGEAFILFKAADPHAESVEANKALAAKLAKIQDKLRSGQKLTSAEKKFAQEHDPQMAAMAERMEQEAAQLEKSLQGCNSKEEARQIYMNTKMRIMSGANKEDGSFLLLMTAVDKAYSQYLGQGSSSQRQLDIRI